MLFIRSLITAICACLYLGAVAMPPKGWQWYNTPPHSKRKRVVSTVQTSHMVFLSQLDAKDQVAVLHYYTINAIDQAILNPSNANVKKAILWQNFWSDRASNFTMGWQRTMLANPTLDYTVTHPTENNTARIALAAQRQAEDQVIARFAKSNGLFFFYRGRAPLDQAFAKVVEGFVAAHHLALIGISMDGALLPGITQNFINHGQAQAIGVKAYPALLLVNPTTHHIQPIHYGFASSNELAKAFLNVARHFKGNF